MTLNEYQQEAMTTYMPTSNNLVYMGFNLSAEVGELLGKLAKAIRKDMLTIYNSDEYIMSNETLTEINNLDEEDMDELKKEAGDVLWQLAGICSVLGFDLENVAYDNLEKLSSRKKRGVIDGKGDNR